IWAAAALAPMGWAGYILWVGFRKNDPIGGYFRVQKRWGSEFDFGKDAWGSVRDAVTGRQVFAHHMVLAVVAVAVVLFVLLALD
ncbi:hypothetical protein ACSNOK_35380, partial [Streptomyces sp. URMC 126]